MKREKDLIAADESKPTNELTTRQVESLRGLLRLVEGAQRMGNVPAWRYWIQKSKTEFDSCPENELRSRFRDLRQSLERAQQFERRYGEGSALDLADKSVAALIARNPKQFPAQHLENAKNAPQDVRSAILRQADWLIDPDL
ncbi:hypothetical protein [Phyllobacterium sophorae]|uniref:hypothetical protein n=1 Tax=Phyllobacterium sophorae TaxID=1520277 RepID=UPI0011B2536F|nr:hypothetical protein [Phyllobacterium sophorae]